MRSKYTQKAIYIRNADINHRTTQNMRVTICVQRLVLILIIEQHKTCALRYVLRLVLILIIEQHKTCALRYVLRLVFILIIEQHKTCTLRYVWNVLCCRTIQKSFVAHKEAGDNNRKCIK